jgi:nucleoside-diphosphate kinase
MANLNLLFQTRQEKLADGTALIISKIIGVLEGNTSPLLDEKLSAFLHQGIRHVILLMSDISYINSTGIGTLVKVCDKFQYAAGTLGLVGMQEKTLSVLRTLGVATAFKIYHTEEEAVEAVGHGGLVKNIAPGKTAQGKKGSDLGNFLERTLILLKPDAVERGCIGDIISRFERKGLKLVGLKMLKMTEETAARHYQEHQGKPFYPGLVQFMTSQPIVAMAIEGIGAVAICRKMTGATFGAQAEPGTIRGDYGISTSYNLIHSSADKESAAREVPIFFNGQEVFSYGRAIDGLIATEEDAKRLNK